MPRWLPDTDMFASPGASLVIALAALALAGFSAAFTPLFGPGACGFSALFLVAACGFVFLGVVPRYAVVRGPELVLGLSSSHLEIGADWPYMPADRLAATLAGMPWAEAGGRRLPWAELRGARLSKDKRHLEIMQRHGEVLRLPVGGSHRWDKTLAEVARELDDHCRRVASGRAPRELDDLRRGR